MAYSYRELHDIYGDLKDAGIVTASLPEWSEDMNRLTKSDMYSQGVHDNFIRRGSVGLDKLLEMTGLPQLGESFGREVGSWFGSPDVGARAGRGIARGALDFVPLAFGPVGVPITAALSGLHAYADTGSPLSGIVGGATAAVLPGAANAFEQLGLRTLGAPLSEATGKLVGEGTAQKLGGYLAGQGGAAGVMGVSDVAEQAAGPEPMHSPFTKDFWLSVGLQTLPFSALHLASKAIGHTENLSAVRDDLKQAKAEKDAVTAPPVTHDDWQAGRDLPEEDQQKVADTNKRIQEIITGKQELRAKPEMSEDDARANEDLQLEWDRIKQEKGTSGFIDGVETSTTQTQKYLTPEQLAEARLQRQEEWAKTQPDLPEQPTDEAFVKWQEAHAMLRAVQNSLDKASTPEALHKAKLAFGEALRTLGVPDAFDDEWLDKEWAKRNEAAKLGTDAEKLQSALNVQRQKANLRFHAEQRKFASRAEAERTVVALTERPTEPEIAGAVAELRSDWTKDPSIFNVTVADWEKQERPGGLEGLRTRVAEKAKTRVKVNVPEPTPETQPVIDTVEALAEMMDVQPGEEADAKEFVKRLQEGTLEKSKDNFLLKPHVGFWFEELQGRLADMRAGNAALPKEMRAPARPEDAQRYQEIQRKLKELGDMSAPGFEELWKESEQIKNKYGDAVPEDTTQANAPRRTQTKPVRLGGEKDVQRVAEWRLDEGGTGTMDYLSKSPYFGALAKDLATRYSGLLSNIKLKLARRDDTSAALLHPDGSVEIHVADSLLRDGDYTQHQTLLHELVHGLTAQLAEDPIAGAPLEELRQKLIEALPKDEKAAFDKAIASDWYARALKGEAEWEEVHPNYSTYLKLYGLLDIHELLAQGFTEREMQKYMQSVKGKKGSVWQQFSGWVQRLLGLGEKVGGTAFGDFLQESGRLMDHGEFLTTFRDFADSYFEGKGLKPEEAEIQSTRAAGVVQTLAHEGSAWDALAQGDSPSTRLQRAALSMLNAWKGDEAEVTKSILTELDHKPTADGLSDMLHEALENGTDIGDALMLMPEPMLEYVLAKVQDYRDVLDGVKAGTSVKQAGAVGVRDAATVRAQVAPLLKAVDRVLLAEKVHQDAVRDLSGLFAVDPAGFVQKWMSSPTAPGKQFSDFVESPGKKGWKWFVNFFQQAGQLAKTSPMAAELITAGHRLQPLTRWAAQKIIEPFGIDARDPDAGITKEGIQATSKLLTGKLKTAINGWIALNQKQGKDKVALLPESHPDVARLLQPLTPEERQVVVNGMGMHGTMKTLADNFRLNKMANTSAWDSVPIFTNGKKAEENFQLSATLFKALTADFNDPAQAATATSTIDSVRQQLSINDWSNLVQFMQGEVQKFKLYQAHFAENIHWATATRYGKFLVEYKDSKGVHLDGVESETEAKALTKGKTLISFKKNERDSDEIMPSIGQTPALYKALAKAQQISEAIAEKVYSPEQFAKYKEINSVAQVATLLQAERGIPLTSELQGRTRQLSKLSESHPWLENQFRWVQRTVNYWNKSEFRAQSRALLGDPEIVAAPEIAQRLTQHVDNLLSPDPEMAQALTRFTSTWMLGFRPSSALVTATHFVIRHSSEFTRMTGNPVQSFKRVISAGNEVIQNLMKGRNYTNPERQWLIKEADKYGERDSGWFDDENSTGEKVALDFLALARGERTQSVGQRLEKAGGVYSRVAMWMFQQARRFNEETALYASFDYYKEQGLSREAARDKAFEFNRAVNPVGGRSQRPIGMFDQSKVPRTAAMLGYSLHSYVLGTIGQLGRYIMEASPWAHEELTPAEKWKARTAAVQMLAMQTGAAGLLGLPFASGALALLNQMFPQMQLDKKLRENVASFMGGDPTWTDMAMTGLPSMLGWDLHSRLTMGNVVPGVNELDGFQPEALLGPPANLALNFVRGTKQIATGDARGVANLMPTAVKQMVQLAQSEGTYRDPKGRPIGTPTSGEVLGNILGFQSERVSRANTASRLAGQAEAVANQEEGYWRQEMAQQALKGNFGSVREGLRQRLLTDPEYDWKAAVHQISRAAEDLTFPRDLRRSGGSHTNRGEFLSTFAGPVTTSELGRLQFRQQIAQRLGSGAPPSAHEIQVARLIDQLREKQPTATRRELRNQVEKLLGSKRGLPLLSESPQDPGLTGQSESVGL